MPASGGGGGGRKGGGGVKENEEAPIPILGRIPKIATLTIYIGLRNTGPIRIWQRY